ncbi:protein SIEVE ELEMENT OCCLUSION [Salix suchowensis]|nr:protein SIEVE ELEMENT OCCLUSION [Salix suchowensis]
MASISMHATAMNQVIPNEIWVSLQSEDSSTMKLVGQAMLLMVAKASPAIVEGIYEDKGFPEEDMIGRSDVDAKLKTLASIIKKVSSELFSYNNLALSGTFKANNVNQITIPYGCSCSGGRDVHTTIMMILDTLSSYSWDAKVVLTVAAFIVNYGHEFLLFTSSEANNSAIAQSIASLKQLRDITDHAKFSKAKIDAIIKLLKVIMAVTRYIVELHNLPLESIATDEAAYWTMLSVVVCASYIASLSGHEESTTELLDLSRLASEGSKVQVILRSYRTIYKEYEDHYEMQMRNLTSLLGSRKNYLSTHSNNMTILKTLLVVDGKQTSWRIHIEELREMNVFLLVSGLDLSKERLMSLVSCTKRLKPRWWETIAWDQGETAKIRAVACPDALVCCACTFKDQSREKIWFWCRLDTQGKFGSLNAIDMLLIRGNKALSSIFSDKEESLWETQKTWTLELLLGALIIILPHETGTMVCLYGENIEWIREFRSNKDAVTNISFCHPMELVYVGKKMQSRNRYWRRLNFDLVFWTDWRACSIENAAMQEFKKRPDNARGMALFCKGSSEMALARGDVALKSMKEFGEWRQSAIDNGNHRRTALQPDHPFRGQAGNPNKKLSSDGVSVPWRSASCTVAVLIK